MNKLIIVSYLNFLRLKENSRKVLAECEYFLVSINEEEYIQLSAEDKKKLVGVALTDVKHNATIIETLKREDLSPRELRFYLKEISPAIDVKVIEQTYKEKHLQKSKPYAPRKMFYAGYNSKKKSGR